MSDHDFRRMTKNDLVREVKRLEALLSQQMEAAPGVGKEIEVVGIVGMTDGSPSVQMRAGEAAWQMTPAKAREHALIVLNAAVEAERDAATVAFFRESEFDEQAIGGFLVGMREHRDNWLAALKR